MDNWIPLEHDVNSVVHEKKYFMILHPNRKAATKGGSMPGILEIRKGY
jgi:hypothetical protein